MILTLAAHNGADVDERENERADPSAVSLISSKTPAYRGRLLPQHQAQLHASAISPDVAEARGYVSVTERVQLAKVGFAQNQQLVPGLLVPQWDVTGKQVGYEYRPDLPRRNQQGKGVKYDRPAGSVNVVNCHPTIIKPLGDPTRALWITEGSKKADAAISAGLACVALNGVWGWRGSNRLGAKLALGDWDSVALEGRRVYLCFDSDVATKPEVAAALSRLWKFLESRRARPKVVYLPDGDDKVGLDDFLAAGHTRADLYDLAVDQLRHEHAMPVPTTLMSFDEIDDETVTWVWQRRVAFGKLAIFEGEPGVSKSVLTCDVVARVSAGLPLPGDRHGGEPSRVILLTAEDGAGDTIKPRLRSHGARLDLVNLWLGPQVLNREGVLETRFPSFPSCGRDLEEAINDVEAKLVVIDPLSAFYDGDIMTNNDASVRRAMSVLAAVAQRTGAAIILVRHLTKDTTQTAMNRGGGSVGIIGAARSAMVIAADPHDADRRIIATVKMNLAKATDKSLAYFVDDDQVNGCPHIRWDGEVTMSADALLAAQLGKDRGTKVDAAEGWLQEYLASGPQSSEQLQQDARKEGHTYATLDRASKRLGVEKRNAGRGTPWTWRLAADSDDETAQ